MNDASGCSICTRTAHYSVHFVPLLRIAYVVKSIFEFSLSTHKFYLTIINTSMPYLHEPTPAATAKQVNKPLPPLPTRATRALRSIRHVWRLVKTKARATTAAAAAAAATPVNEEGRRSYESWITESFHSEVSRRSSI